MEGIADYTELRPYGHGDEGAFYLATPPARLGSPGPVVLKVLDVALEPERLRRVTQELQLFAAVDSPYLVRLLDAGHEDGRFFYAVEHLGRGTLAEPAGDLEPSGILKVVADAARGAHALHEEGIAHRAISPAKVVLHDEGGKLADLELARFINPGMTVTSVAPVASVEYTDPAIIRGERAGRASDIWSLGVTLHRAISGRSVYGEELPAGDLLGAVRRLLSARPEVADGVDPPVANIVMACLAIDPDDRPPTALAVAERLEELL
jgi:serine/threonine protein kinase